MPMTNHGLSKLVEEIGELGQVAGKMLQYPKLMWDNDARHPDGGTDLRSRAIEEMGDVIAAINFVREQLKLNEVELYKRAGKKLELFRRWNLEP